jgi:LuxR family transcriptional regulator
VRHPVPFTRPKIPANHLPKVVDGAQYQSANYFAIDPVLKPENFIQGHLPGQMHYSPRRRNYGTAPRSRFTLGNNAVPDAAKSCAWFPVSVRTRVQEGPLAHEEIEQVANAGANGLNLADAF